MVPLDAFTCTRSLFKHNVLWTQALHNVYGLPFVTLNLVKPSESKVELQRLKAVTSLKQGNWEFSGYQREGADLSNPNMRVTAHEWKLCVNVTPEGTTGVIWWWCTQSQWFSTIGMGNWLSEEIRGSFDPETGILSCQVLPLSAPASIHLCSTLH